MLSASFRKHSSVPAGNCLIKSVVPAHKINIYHDLLGEFECQNLHEMQNQLGVEREER